MLASQAADDAAPQSSSQTHVTGVTDGAAIRCHYFKEWEGPMIRNSAAARTLCLLDENAQCNPIWVARPDGLRLAHFQTLQEEMAGRENKPADAAYKSCERECLQRTSP